MKVYKKKLKRHNDQIMSIYSPLGIEGGILVSGSADHEIRSNYQEFNLIHNVEWHLVKKKISNRIDVERPEEDILLRYRENSHEPLPNYAEDHILNTVSKEFVGYDFSKKVLTFAL